MSTPTAAPSIPLKNLVLSQTESQIERRAHFDKAGIAELAISLTSTGLLNPIVVRPMGPDEHDYEVVAGERRLMAAQKLGWSEIPCSVRTLTDAQVIEVQLVENLQREGLHELAEAEAYEGLQKVGLTAEQIAAKCGRSPSYVLKRLRLKTLGKAARRAFYDGKFGFTIALEIAKLPVVEHQDELLRWFEEESRYEPVTAESLREQIEQDYLSALKGAPFPTGEHNLIPKTHACQACPKRTGAQGALFDQVKGLGHCLDLVCFNAKKKAHGERLLEEAKERGQKVLKNQAAVPDAYVRMDEQPDYSYGKSVKQLLDKDYKPTLVQLKSGEVVQVAAAEDVKKVLPKAPARSSTSHREDDYRARQRTEDRKRKIEIEYRRQLLQAIIACGSRKGDDLLPDLRIACSSLAGRLHHDATKALFKAMGWEPKEKRRTYGGNYKDYDLKPYLAGYETQVELLLLLRILSVANDLMVYNHQSVDRKDDLHRMAESFGLKPAQLLENVKAAAAAKKKPNAKGKKAGKVKS